MGGEGERGELSQVADPRLHGVDRLSKKDEQVKGRTKGKVRRTPNGTRLVLVTATEKGTPTVGARETTWGPTRPDRGQGRRVPGLVSGVVVIRSFVRSVQSIQGKRKEQEKLGQVRERRSCHVRYR